VIGARGRGRRGSESGAQLAYDHQRGGDVAADERKIIRQVDLQILPVGTVITTGDQVPAAAVPAATALLSAVHVAVEPLTAAPQL